jgi:hypothetical protein
MTTKPGGGSRRTKRPGGKTPTVRRITAGGATVTHAPGYGRMGGTTASSSGASRPGGSSQAPTPGGSIKPGGGAKPAAARPGGHPQGRPATGPGGSPTGAHAALQSRQLGAAQAAQAQLARKTSGGTKPKRNLPGG